ncbi:hypothetical protein PG996_000174 [Apiospora saccharicola]|uniref:Uncharacterized protein n=1 Tax=Apiospora saccharicola TaxID=335842 RepID=A0ABR1WH39_9PEZI
MKSTLPGHGEGGHRCGSFNAQRGRDYKSKSARSAHYLHRKVALSTTACRSKCGDRPSCGMKSRLGEPSIVDGWHLAQLQSLGGGGNGGRAKG